MLKYSLNILLFFGLMFCHPIMAISVLPLDLNTIIADAHIAFQGKCLNNATEQDPQTGSVVTYTTFEVQDVLKGQVGSTYTIKQMGGKTADNNNQIIESRVEGVPTFSLGETYVVFLYGISSAGFSSPVGLEQGKFSVIKDSVNFQVTNGRDFKEMIEGEALRQLSFSVQTKLLQAPGAVNRLGLEEFKQLVRQQIKGKK